MSRRNYSDHYDPMLAMEDIRPTRAEAERDDREQGAGVTVQDCGGCGVCLTCEARRRTA